ncbi:MAG: thioredoxin [Candidatus Omnitrophota bacterium]
MPVIHLNNSNFKKEIIENKEIALVDFWANWCGPCKMIAPLIDEIAKDYDGKIKVAKLNIDDAADIASQYGIMSIPTLLFFKNGQVVGQVVGAISKSEIKEKINNIL